MAARWQQYLANGWWDGGLTKTPNLVLEHMPGTPIGARCRSCSAGEKSPPCFVGSKHNLSNSLVSMIGGFIEPIEYTTLIGSLIIKI